MTGFLPDFTVSSVSKEYIQVPVTLSDNANPTGDTVAMAFSPVGSEPSVFYAGIWTTLAGIYYVNVLIGPGSSAVLPVGYYEVYVKITDASETPVIRSGLLEVT